MNETTVTTPNELEIRVERIFDAPRAHVFSVWTDPKLIPEWWGDGTVVEEMDVRPGGTYRFRTAFGVVEGEFREVDAPERLVQTFQNHLQTLEFEDLGDQTKLTQTMRFATTEERDTTMQYGVEEGAKSGFARVDALLAAATARRVSHGGHAHRVDRRRDERGASAVERAACRAGQVVVVAGKPGDDSAPAGGGALEAHAIVAARVQCRALARDLHEGAVLLLLERDDDALTGVVRTHRSPGAQTLEALPHRERGVGRIGRRARARPPQLAAVDPVGGGEEQRAAHVGKRVRPRRAARVDVLDQHGAGRVPSLFHSSPPWVAVVGREEQRPARRRRALARWRCGRSGLMSLTSTVPAVGPVALPQLAAVGAVVGREEQRAARSSSRG